MPLKIKGFIETSMVDWDGKVSSVIFLPGCNFRCPYCQNGLLISSPEKLKTIPFEEIKKYLSGHKKWIDGVVLTGGEPTIHKDLKHLIKKIKDLGFLVKLDTNGSNPKMLKQLIKAKMIDFVAMDLKAPLDERYNKACGVKVDIKKIKESIKIIMEGKIDHEFRCTVVPTIIDEDGIEAMARSIEGAKKFVLQQFQPEHAMDEKMKILEPYPKEKLEKLSKIASKYVKTKLRGI